MGGNIGLPILAQDPLPEGGVYVLELSSYQIDLTQSLDCDVAVLLNVTPDHLDRYESFEAYALSKWRLFAMQSENHVGVFNYDDEQVWQLLDSVDLDILEYRGRDIREDATLIREGREPLDAERGTLQPLLPALQGAHNAANASM